MKIKALGATRYCRSPVDPSRVWFDAIINTRQHVISSGGSSSSSTKDANFTVYTTATVDNECDFLLTNFGAQELVMPTFTAQNTSVATVSSDGKLTRVADGTAQIRVDGGKISRLLTFATARTGGTASNQFNGFVTGSLGKHLVDSINTLLSGLTASSTTLGIFDPAKSVYDSTTTRNSSVWTGSAVDLTCIPTQITTGAGTNGCLISPRDMLKAAHYSDNPGTAVTFMGADNTQYSRTYATVNRSVVSGSDLCLLTLNSDLPAAITPAKLLPANFRNYLPQPQYAYPVVWTDRLRNLYIADLLQDTSGNEVTIYKSTDATRLAWYAAVVGGDSGSPAFMLINNHLVHLTDWHTSNLSTFATGPDDADSITQINAAMTANGSPYSVSTVDLSGFNSY